MYNCRLNPSVNGNLHLGHLYMAMINETIAHESGGRFIVRFDDSHLIRISVLGRDKIELIRKGQQDDLEWLGFKPDKWIKQSDIIDEVHEYLSKHATIMPDENPPAVPEIIGSDVMLYPLTTMLTAEKVVMDWMEGVNLLVRGVDLLSEYSLYQYYCRLLGFPQPLHIYLPRLRWEHGDMSKTGYAQSISDLRYNGCTPGQVWEMVATACLVNVPNGWTLHNLKGEPRLCS